MEKIDPVCEMIVESHSQTTTYLDMKFFFCSHQCKQRFLANPHLYIGFPGQKAPKQAGEKIVKHRRILLHQTLSDKNMMVVYTALLSLMGMERISISGATIEISYDLLQVTLQQIEDELISKGFRLNRKWLNQLHRKLLHESEESQIDSMEVTPQKHCR